jgi:hypothetical protein
MATAWPDAPAPRAPNAKRSASKAASASKAKAPILHLFVFVMDIRTHFQRF